MAKVARLGNVDVNVQLHKRALITSFAFLLLN